MSNLTAEDWYVLYTSEFGAEQLEKRSTPHEMAFLGRMANDLGTSIPRAWDALRLISRGERQRAEMALTTL